MTARPSFEVNAASGQADLFVEMMDKLSAAVTSWRNCLSAARIFASMTVSSSMSSQARSWRVWATMPAGGGAVHSR